MFAQAGGIPDVKVDTTLLGAGGALLLVAFVIVITLVVQQRRQTTSDRAADAALRKEAAGVDEGARAILGAQIVALQLELRETTVRAEARYESLRDELVRVVHRERVCNRRVDLLVVACRRGITITHDDGTTEQVPLPIPPEVWSLDPDAPHSS